MGIPHTSVNLYWHCLRLWVTPNDYAYLGGGVVSQSDPSVSWFDDVGGWVTLNNTKEFTGRLNTRSSEYRRCSLILADGPLPALRRWRA